jgi:hypothetical protein
MKNNYIDYLFILTAAILIAFIGMVSFKMTFPSNQNSLASVLSHIATTNEYRLGVYDCKNFSVELKKELIARGVASEVVVGKRNGEGHAWVAIWIEPETGKVITPNENYKAEKDNAYYSYLNSPQAVIELAQK